MGLVDRLHSLVLMLKEGDMLSQRSIRTLMAIRRQMLVTGLFRHVEEIQKIDDGYAFKFRRSKQLIRRMADYLLFEGRNSPQLTFVILAEAQGTVVWLLVRWSGDIWSACAPPSSSMSSHSQCQPRRLQSHRRACVTE
jgi:hypothetical protein